MDLCIYACVILGSVFNHVNTVIKSVFEEFYFRKLVRFFAGRIIIAKCSMLGKPFFDMIVKYSVSENQQFVSHTTML